MNPWLILIIAGLFEIGWAVGLKYTEGFTRLWPSVGTLLAMIISMGLLGLAQMQKRKWITVENERLIYSLPQLPTA